MELSPTLVQALHPSGGSLELGSEEKDQVSTRKAQVGTPMSRKLWEA